MGEGARVCRRARPIDPIGPEQRTAFGKDIFAWPSFWGLANQPPLQIEDSASCRSPGDDETMLRPGKAFPVSQAALGPGRQPNGLDKRGFDVPLLFLIFG